VRCLLAVALLVFLPAGSVLGEVLKEISDTQLVDLLNNLEILAEHKKPPYWIRVLRLREHGECDGPPETCPQATLFITASTFGEYPDQQAYRLPKAYGWEFVRWKQLAQREGQDSFTSIELKRQVITKTSPKGGLSEEKYEVLVNPWKAHLKEESKRSR